MHHAPWRDKWLSDRPIPEVYHAEMLSDARTDVKRDSNDNPIGVVSYHSPMTLSCILIDAVQVKIGWEFKYHGHNWFVTQLWTNHDGNSRLTRVEARQLSLPPLSYTVRYA